MKSMLLKSGFAAAAALAAAAAHAVDTTAVESELSVGLNNVETIGSAVLLIAVAIAVFKYVKKAF